MSNACVLFIVNLRQALKCSGNTVLNCIASDELVLAELDTVYATYYAIT